MDWKKKLSSRKFWALSVSLVTSIIVIFSTEEVAAQVSGILLQLGSVIAYIWGEATIDAEYAKKDE